MRLINAVFEIDTKNRAYSDNFCEILQLGTQAIGDICKKYLGTSKVHTTRHTGTLLRLKAGATVQDIKKQLGHDSLATTDYYVEILLQGPDKHATHVEAMLL
jgi:integrase